MDGIVSSQAIKLVFEDTAVPPIKDELEANGGTRTGSLCADCNGPLYDINNEVVCGSCSMVIDNERDTQSFVEADLWEQFNRHRPTYYNSPRKRCVGGFPQAHDWVASEDIQHPVRELSPGEFYDG